MAVDCAKELKSHNVAFVSVWPGPVRTEHIEALAAAAPKDDNREVAIMLVSLRLKK